MRSASSVAGGGRRGLGALAVNLLAISAGLLVLVSRPVTAVVIVLLGRLVLLVVAVGHDSVAPHDMSVLVVGRRRRRRAIVVDVVRLGDYGLADLTHVVVLVVVALVRRLVIDLRKKKHSISQSKLAPSLLPSD